MLSDQIGLKGFNAWLRHYHGEIKGILTWGSFLSGIGNAYSDEILFATGLFPLRKRKTLSEGELQRLHYSAHRVVVDAAVVLRKRMEGETHHKIRDFLQVHNKGGLPVPNVETPLAGSPQTSA